MSKLVVNVLKDLHSVNTRLKITEKLNEISKSLWTKITEPRNVKKGPSGLLLDFCFIERRTLLGSIESRRPEILSYHVCFFVSMRWEILAGANESPGFPTQWIGTEFDFLYT